MGGTREVAGGLRSADKAGLSPSSPCPKGMLAPKILASHGPATASLARAEEAGSCQAGELFPCPVGLPERQKTMRTTW